MIYYKIIIRIGIHEFEKDFLDETAAIACFDDLAINQDGEVVDGQLTMKADALVDTVEIRRYNDALTPRGAIGDPRRQ